MRLARRGLNRGIWPAGWQFFGRGWDEARLIKLAYDYEQATRHRKPPVTVPLVR